MQVRDGMTDVVLTVGPGHTLRDAAAAMCRRQVGAAVVLDPEAPGPGVITERDILLSMGSGDDPDSERVADHLTKNLTFASPDWSLERAAAAMIRGRFRHLVVVDGGRARRDPVDARHRALLDRGRGHLRGPGRGRRRRRTAGLGSNRQDDALAGPTGRRCRKRGPKALVRVLLGELAHVATRVADPDPHGDEEDDQPRGRRTSS